MAVALVTPGCGRTLSASVGGAAAGHGGKEAAVTSFRISSPAFGEGQPIPADYTADGSDVNPPLEIRGVPAGARSLALIMDDPDAPRGTWVHWVVWNIPADTAMIPADSVPVGAVQGRNSWGRTAYGGPAPPSGTHRYFFKLYALDTTLDLPPSTDKAGLLAAMKGHVLGEAQLMGTYSRKR
ncbi:MAG: YbhB/YbcL family Raf kinase inhibitor-like protein [Acidobacteria bacterium]|nr:YbhB/YbcL family Raf kinase inhibitor-like protein [Acidobacteriota bacterium]